MTAPRRALGVLGWFLRAQAVSVVAAGMLAVGCALWSHPLGLIVGALSLAALEVKTEADWRHRTGVAPRRV